MLGRLMKRNLQQGVDVAAPITRSNSRYWRLRELLGPSLSDAGAWEMLPDGDLYRRVGAYRRGAPVCTTPS
jgi:polyphosphate kinase